MLAYLTQTKSTQMGKVKKFFKLLTYSILFFVLTFIGLIVYMSVNEGEKIDRDGLDRGFVKQSLNVRAGAGTDFDILKTLSIGDKFYVADTLDNGWFKMVLGSENSSFSTEDESYAYVYGNYVYPINDFDIWEQSYQQEQQILRAESELEENKDDIKYEFEQVGYFKGSNNTRVYTFEIKTDENIIMGSVPNELWQLIETHGSNRMNTSGRNTQSFYYLSGTNIPDVTLSSDFDMAYEKAYEVQPLALVYIQFNGQKGLAKHPTY